MTDLCIGANRVTSRGLPDTSVRAGTVSVFFPSEAVKVETTLLSSLAVLVEAPATQETPARSHVRAGVPE